MANQQNVEDFVRRLFLDSGFMPTQENMEKVLENIPEHVKTAGNTLLAALPYCTYVQIAEGEEIEGEEINVVLGKIWETFENWG